MEGIRILVYHSVGKVDPRDDLGIRIDKDNFLRQMEFLKENNYNLWTLRDAIDYMKERRPIPQRGVVITFDDGYKDNISNAAPIMEGFDFRATFFVTVDYIGGVKTNPDRDWQRWECMDWNDLKTLIDRGHDIGSHSYHHINLGKLTKEVKQEELRLSRQKIGSLLNKDIEFFSYPYGYFDQELIKIVKSEGYKAACTTIIGENNHSTDLYKLRRTEIVNKDTQDEFRDKLEGRYD